MSEDLYTLSDYGEFFEWQKERTVRNHGVVQLISPMSKFRVFLRIYGFGEFPFVAMKNSITSLFRDVAHNGHKPYGYIEIEKLPSDMEDIENWAVSVNTVKDL